MSGIILTSIFGILVTIAGTVWMIIELLQQFEKNLQGFFMFAVLAFIILFIAKGLLRNFLDAANY